MRKTICSILFLTLLAIFPVSLWSQTGTIYFVNTSNWAAPYAYCWSPNIVAWPGQAMTTSIQTSQNHDVYAYRTNNAYGTMTSTNHGWWKMDGDGVGGSLYTNITTPRGGTYTFKYDWAENMISVDWPESECTGSGLRHFDGFGEPIEYKVEYADGKINFSVWAIDPAKRLIS